MFNGDYYKGLPSILSKPLNHDPLVDNGLVWKNYIA
jgi:hypothetical protein